MLDSSVCDGSGSDAPVSVSAARRCRRKMSFSGRTLTVMDMLTKPVHNSQTIVLKSLALRRLTESVASTVMPMVGRTNLMPIQWILLDT